jgi:predicted Fe-Mo cluster-binding NifX family protein
MHSNAVNSTRRDYMPDEKLRIAVPSMEQGGLDDILSGHFGHCAAFTLVDVEGNEVKNVTILENPPHHQGGCMSPVMLLKDNGVDIIIVGGIGMRPLMGFEEVGIKVYGGAAGTIEFIINEFLEGRLSPAGEDIVCGHSRQGHGHGHDHGPGCGGH